jgi:ligand-binding SRPBCC domain-containing protein
MKTHQLETEVWLPRRRDEVFAFFADAANLEVLTPLWLNFHILTPEPIEMKAGTRLQYRLKVRGFPLRWESEITTWEPPRRFADQQRRGPYRLWIHQHTFIESKGGTVVGDHIRYAVPGGALVNRFFVAPDLERIFRYRHQQLLKLFGAAH